MCLFAQIFFQRTHGINDDSRLPCVTICKEIRNFPGKGNFGFFQIVTEQIIHGDFQYIGNADDGRQA